MASSFFETEILPRVRQRAKDSARRWRDQEEPQIRATVHSISPETISCTLRINDRLMTSVSPRFPSRGC